jgi:hypothetical protein
MPTLERSQVYSAQAPRSTWQGHQTRTPRRGLHSRRKILGVQSRLAGLTKAHRPRKVTHPGHPTRLAELYTYQGIVRPKYSGTPTSRRSFWCPDDQHRCWPPSGAVILRYCRPFQQQAHRPRGPMEIVDLRDASCNIPQICWGMLINKIVILKFSMNCLGD